VFNERPLKAEILQYCRQDVELLPTLWEVYSCKLLVPSNGFWRSMVRQAIRERIKLSRSVHYDGQSKSKVCGPWDSYNIEDSIEDWNDDVMIWGVNAGMILDQDDQWVNPPQKQVLKSSVFTLVAVV
jgi:exonuclease 3'-5' domain-containing protein 1